MTEPDQVPAPPLADSAGAPARQPAGQHGRHRAEHQPVPGPPIAGWLPRVAAVGGVAVAVALGLLATTGSASTPTRQAPATADSADASAASIIARLSKGAPRGAKLLRAAPVHVGRPAAVTPAVITGLAADGIPNIALNAYRVAAARLASADPDCGIQWWLLAGIGRVESNHGRYGGATLSATGVSSPHIIGGALDGTSYDYIADTDGGRLDADPRVDHAVGPMQFIPSTWASYGIDGNGDGVADPFNINDAGLAAARYLCAAGGNLRDAAGQNRAVLAYNHSDEYLALVLATARAYATGVPLDEPITGVSTGALPPVDGSWFPPVNPGAPTAYAAQPSSRPARNTGGRLGGIPSGAAGAPGGRPAPSGSKSPTGGGAGTGGAGGTGSGSSGSGSGGSGSGPGGTGSGGSGSGGSGSAGSGSAGSGSGGSGSGGSGAGPSQPASLPSVPLPTGPLPTLPVPIPTGQAVPTGSPSTVLCTVTNLLGIVIQVPCGSH